MEGPKITVVIRKRPLGKKEIQRGDLDIVNVKDQATVVVSELKYKLDLTKYVEQHYFNFDMAFDEAIDNQGVYCSSVRPIVQAAFNKAKCTCFAYGQTGSGKTYTMLGDPDKNVPGLYLMASYDIFALAQKAEYQHLSIFISFYEIYCGKLFDLLNDRQQLAAQEDAKGNVQIKGLNEKKITNVQQLMQIIQYGQNNRITSANSANSESSRSHALLQIQLKFNKLIHGKISFIDLAGSERGADVRDQDKTTRVDGAEINKSLLALKECIRALDLNKNHTPFRGSKLTLVLKDSFVGNCKTVMIGNISPSNSNSEHTLNTLRYADRVKELRKPQDQKNIDGANRELFLARGDNNVVRKEYRNPDSDDDNFGTHSVQQGSQGGLQKQNKQNYINSPPTLLIQRTQSAHNKLQLSDSVEVLNKKLQKQNQQPFQIPTTFSCGQNINQPPLFSESPQELSLNRNQSFSYQNLLEQPLKCNFFQPQSPQSEIPQPLFNSGFDFAMDDLNDDMHDNLLLDEVEPEQELKNQQLKYQMQDIEQKILIEKDKIGVGFRDHIDFMVDVCKTDMMILNSLDQDQMQFQEYFTKLKEVLIMKQQQLLQFENSLDNYTQLVDQVSFYYKYSDQKLDNKFKVLVYKIVCKIIQIINKMTDQNPIDYLSEIESSQFNFRQSDMILYQPYSPQPFRVACSPHTPFVQDFYIAQPNEYQDDFFPFEQQPIQKMFDLPTSGHQSPSLKQVVIKQSNNRQQGFQIVQINTTQISPQKRRSEQTRRYQSEKKEQRQTNYANFQEQTPQKAQKGLRNLSVKVRDIVLELKSTSYKDVAQRLIQDLGSDGFIVELDNPKDEQNIKRRVYDALNVMIASKVLRKEGKKVISDIYCIHRMKKNETEMFKEELFNLKNIIKEKKKRLQELFIKILALKNLVIRNSKKLEENKFMFPILTFQADQQQIRLRMDSKILKIMSQQKLMLQADLDILVQMKMFNLCKNIEDMPKNLLELVQYNDLCS